MHIYFSGIGGTAIGPLALIAHQAGYRVSGSDKQDSQYIQYLRKQGISDIQIGQTAGQITSWHQSNPIDWIVYSSAVAIENPNHPELVFAEENNIPSSKRDQLLNKIISDTNKKLIAVAGTHGKTTTTAMAIWLFKQLNVPISYSVGAKMSFADMGHFDAESEFFIYECDEFDRNFLEFHPYLSLVTGVDYDHHEIFPTIDDYEQAFKQFVSQSRYVIGWTSDNHVIDPDNTHMLLDDQSDIIDTLHIPGRVNRRDAWQVIVAAHELLGANTNTITPLMEAFPGLSRRFEKLRDNLYTDYAHTIPKIIGCLQMAQEISDNVVVVYEPLTNRRQHYIRDDYEHLFNGVKRLYWVPSYLAREDPEQHVLSPAELIESLNTPEIAKAAELDDDLQKDIQTHLDQGDLVVCISGGGGGSLDEWLRKSFITST